MPETVTLAETGHSDRPLSTLADVIVRPREDGYQFWITTRETISGFGMSLSPKMHCSALAQKQVHLIGHL